MSKRGDFQVDLVYGWVLNLVTMCQKTGVVLTAPPIYSRIYQELSNGMLGFTQVSASRKPPPRPRMGRKAPARRPHLPHFCA